MTPFIRNLLILAVVALAIVVLNAETALATAGTLLRFAFFIAIAVVAYFFWRDVGRREIELWPSLQQWVFYSAVALFVVEILNTSVEAAIDRISDARHPLSKLAKDLGSAAVFIAALFALIVWLALAGPVMVRMLAT